MILGGRGVGVYWEGLWPAGCNDVEYGGDRGAVEGLKYFNEDEFLVKEEWVCGGVVIEVVADAFWR